MHCMPRRLFDSFTDTNATVSGKSLKIKATGSKGITVRKEDGSIEHPNAFDVEFKGLKDAESL